MALTANPLINCTSAHGDISSMKTYQNFSGAGVTGTTQSYAAPWNYMSVAANGTTLNQILTGQGLTNFGYTAIVVSTGNQEIWATRNSVPSTGAPSGTTPFVKIFFSGNENIASGDMASP
jgi:hypothetical protein